MRWFRSSRSKERPVPPPAAPPPVEPAPPAAVYAEQAWPAICDNFAVQLLVLAEQLRPELDQLETDENDPDRLQRLYSVDHAVTRMRRAARDLRILAGSNEELGGQTSSLLDVIRMAESSIEHYTQVSIATVAELALVAYVADDVASLLAALLDNATRYSPSTVTVSAHLLDDGGVMFRIEDTGIGIAPEQVASLNATLAGPVPDVGSHIGKHTGFPVVHRLAHKHGIRVRLACRTSPGSGAPGGTLAMVTVPPQLVCEIPAPSAKAEPPPVAARRTREPVRPSPALAPAPSPASAPAPAPAPVTPSPDELSTPTVNGLPRRRRTSLRGAERSIRPEGSASYDEAAARRSFADDLSAFTTGQAARDEQVRFDDGTEEP